MKKKMPIQNRLDDARANLAEGRLDAAMLCYVTAIAAASKKRYPDKTGDKDAFCTVRGQVKTDQPWAG